MTSEPMVLGGDGRIIGVGASPAPCRITLEDAGFEIDVQGANPLFAAYRDLATITVQPGSTLLVLGEGPGAVRVIVERMGDRLATLVRELRERRTRQRLGDALVQPQADPFELVEYTVGAEHAVAQIAFQPWGAELVPVDERLGWRRVRRGAIRNVAADGASGTVRVELTTDDVAPDTAGTAGTAGTETVALHGLGDATARWAAGFTTLRDSALRDAATLVADLIPDAPFGTRQRLGGLLVDGRPAGIDDLGPDGAILDRAVLTEPVFAASFKALLDRAGSGAPRWFGMAPESPGTNVRRAWYLVALPGNLIALELISSGAHATYCFRIVPRATFDGASPAQLLPAAATAGREISAALIDARFLREPMALPEAQLADAGHVRYRLALAALPTLAAARRRFVARLVHDDPARWASALDDLITWHGACRDDAAGWPGRSAEESAVLGAGSEAGTDALGTD